MKKFILEIALLSLLALFSIEQLSNIEKPPRVTQISDIKEMLAIVNLGTSHGNNFNFSGLTLHGQSFNRAGNTLYYDLQNYRYIKEHLAEGAIILLPVSYFSFGLDENRTDRGIDNPFINDFYEYLPSSAIHSFSAKKYLSIKVNRIQKNFRSLFPSTKQQKKKKKKLPLDSVQHAAMLKDFAIKRVVHHKKIGTFSSPEKNIEYLNALISDAKMSGFHPVLITTPYYHEYADRFEADWLSKNYYQYINTISTKHNIPFLDYGLDTRFSRNSTLYTNADHLNKKGKAAFNQVLFQDLEKLGILPEGAIKKRAEK